MDLSEASLNLKNLLFSAVFFWSCGLSWASLNLKNFIYSAVFPTHTRGFGFYIFGLGFGAMENNQTLPQRVYNLSQQNNSVIIEGKSRKQPSGKCSQSPITSIPSQLTASVSMKKNKTQNYLNGLHQNGNRGTGGNRFDQQDSSDAVEEENGIEEDGRETCAFESQDADYYYIPGLNDELALLCLARTSRAEYDKLFSINKRYLTLSQSGELYRIRRKNGIYEQWVYMLTSDPFKWRTFDPKLGRWRKLPTLPSDTCFSCGDKESLCAGTDFLVLGREIAGPVIWRYELVTNKWYRGFSMITPRCLFASASCADFAFVAGGISLNGEILKCAEKYDPVKKRWESLPDMHKRRRLCSGCFMDNRFYVIGGTAEDGVLTCGEYYDFERKTWELIPDMIPQSITQAPPLVAVVNDELYALEASTNQLKIYFKRSNKWRVLGEVPVRADYSSGWGVAFKSLGDKLLVIGRGIDSYHSIYTSHPDPNGQEVDWHFVTKVGGSSGSFVFNCAIMST